MTVLAKVIKYYFRWESVGDNHICSSDSLASFIFSDRTSDGIPEFRFFQIISDYSDQIPYGIPEFRSIQINSDRFLETESNNSDHFRFVRIFQM